MFKLIYSNFHVRRVRTLLTMLAIGLSCSLVVVVTSGYASIVDGAEEFISRYMGTADAEITRPQSIENGLIPESLADQIQSDADVHVVTARLESFTHLFDDSGKDRGTFHLIGIRRPQDRRANILKLDKGNWFETSNGVDAVIDQAAARTLKVDVGDTFYLPTQEESVVPARKNSTATGNVSNVAHGRLELKVVGIVRKPEIFATVMHTVYLPLETMQAAEGLQSPQPEVSSISIDLNRGVDPSAFADRWQPRLAQWDNSVKGTSAPLKLELVSRSREDTEANLRVLKLGSSIGSAIAMLAGTFIIFSALSMGVTERQRTLAMLRAVGATRFQLAFMVISEGLLVSFLGAALVGVPLGIVWTHCLRWLFQGFIFFAMGVHVSPSGMVLAIVGAVVAGGAASLLPAWMAATADPLEALSPMAEPGSQTPPIRWALLGLVLAGFDPIIFRIPLENVVSQLSHAGDVSSLTTLLRFYCHFFLGVPGIFVGFFLMAPLMIWAMERTLAGFLGTLFRLPTALLRQQLSHGLWRSAGAAAALMCGLTLLIVLTTEATSMLGGWRLPDKFPDLFLLSLKFGGLSPDQWKQLGDTPGIRKFPDGKPEFMPIAIVSPGLGSNPLALVGAALYPHLTSTLFFGVDPKLAFQLIQLDFRDNDGNTLPPDQQALYAQRAEKELAEGRHVIVTEDYRVRTHCKYGDTVSFYSGFTKYTYTICGIVWPPGMDVFVGLFDLNRLFAEQTAGMAVGSIADAAHDFGATNVNAFVANLDYGVDRVALIKTITHRMGDLDIQTGDVREIKANVDDDFHRLIRLLSIVAFSAMGVASLGVTNTIMASIRSRRWRLGVLRGLGLCRGELLRLVLAEAFCLGLAGAVLGLLSGAVLASDARLLSGAVMGYFPPLMIPWGYVAVGGLTVMTVSVLAALWPAVSVARTEPLKLLQAGRAST